MIDPAELCEQALYDPDDTELWDRAGYALGLHYPNYPMPAIQYDWQWCIALDRTSIQLIMFSHGAYLDTDVDLD